MIAKMFKSQKVHGKLDKANSHVSSFATPFSESVCQVAITRKILNDLIFKITLLLLDEVINKIVTCSPCVGYVDMIYQHVLEKKNRLK